MQIYTSNSDPDYGKEHAASCRHVRDGGVALHPNDDLITVADLVDGHFDWCSKCGGYAVRRLTDAQLVHYRAAHKLQYINEAPHQSVDKRQHHPAMISAAALIIQRNPSSQYETMFPGTPAAAR
ncbi:hypothetical protein [Nonomuraea sp. B19D2]|uniref:hypothetical protein n=1 Tax=Nonomuraea sp. B19D2 TaxID=3159561 RepID=UPI0032DAEED3